MTEQCIALPTSPDAPLLLHGDCLDLLAQLPDASVHAVVTDPPAGIGFMGKPWDSFAGYRPRTRAGVLAMRRLVAAERTWEWRASFAGEAEVAIVRVPMSDGTVMILDGHDEDPLPAWAVGFVAFLADVWSEVDRVLKPGGWVCAWALPKTADLSGLAGRAVGWEVHDSLLHLFGGGMPKGLNIGKALDNVDVTAPATEAARRWDGWNTQLAPGHEQWLLFRKPTRLTYAANVLEHCTGALHVDACRIPRGDGARTGETSGGSWPRNVLLTCGGEECPAEALDRQSGTLTSGGRSGAAYAHDTKTEGWGNLGLQTGTLFADKGGASRFFTRFDDRVGYFPKASDRSAGLRSDIANQHPTHKSVDLMRWIVRLLAATAETTGDEAAIVLDCFMGSGPTGVACVAERVRFIGIEREASSFEVARARILAAIGSPDAAAEANEAARPGAQLALL